jgi:hypothetical protein
MADIPWWGTSLITAVVSVLATVYALKRGVGASGAAMPGGIGSLVIETITYIPHILLLFGVLADMFTMQGIYSIPSLVGIFSIPLNWVLQYFWAGLIEVFGYLKQLGSLKPGETASLQSAAAATVAELAAKPSTATQRAITGGAINQYSGCAVQGFEKLQSKYAPQTLVVTATVFSYYLIDLLMNRGIINSVATIVVFGVVFVGQTFFIGDASGECVAPGGEITSKFVQALIALAEGFLFGGSAFSVVNTYYPNKLPSSAIPSIKSPNVRDLSPGPGGTMVDKEGIAWKVLPDGSTVLDTCAPSTVARIAGATGAATVTQCPTAPGAAADATTPAPAS